MRRIALLENQITGLVVPKDRGARENRQGPGREAAEERMGHHRRGSVPGRQAFRSGHRGIPGTGFCWHEATSTGARRRPAPNLALTTTVLAGWSRRLSAKESLLDQTCGGDGLAKTAVVKQGTAMLGQGLVSRRCGRLGRFGADEFSPHYGTRRGRSEGVV